MYRVCVKWRLDTWESHTTVILYQLKPKPRYFWERNTRICASQFALNKAQQWFSQTKREIQIQYYASRDQNAFRICIPDDAILNVDIAVDYPIVVHYLAIFY